MQQDLIGANLLPNDNRVLSVSAFTRAVKDLLESKLGSVWLRGEISNFRRQQNGHCYFSLKDARSQVSAVIFRGDAEHITHELCDGLQVVVYGEVNVYEPRGNYQLIVRYLIEDGRGRLQAEFERLKAKLAQEGLFDPEKKKPLPLLPKTVGFVTSPTGAAIRDFISILQRRHWKGDVIVFPSKVQGEGATGEIVARIQDARQVEGVDLLIVGRGGGSLEDLWPFNEEKVVRAITACPIPVISAVGHEIDFTLSDFCADSRAETPSAAAELVSSSFLKCLDQFQQEAKNLSLLVEDRLGKARNQLELLQSILKQSSPQRQLEHRYLLLDDYGNRLAASFRESLAARRDHLHQLSLRLMAVSPETCLNMQQLQLKELQNRLKQGGLSRLQSLHEDLGRLTERLAGVLPSKVTQRGFAIVKDAQGRLVTAKKGLSKGQKLRNHFHDGEIGVEITEP